MNDWREVKLGDICDYISRGITPKYADEGILVLNQKCIRDNMINFNIARYSNESKKISSDKLIKKNDILINSTGMGTLGRVAQIKNEIDNATVDSHITIVRPKGDIHATFLGYNLFLQQPNIEALAEGSTGQTELSRARLAEAISINLPLINEQKAIADTLSCLDDKIELNNRINKTLEEMAGAIFKRWFVDFNYPDENGNPYKDSGGEMIESELGMIPKGWRVGKLTDIANFINGLAMQHYRPEEKEKGLPVIKIKELRAGITDNSEKCSENIDKKFIINDGDLIFSWSGTLIVDFWCGGKCGLNQHLYKVSSDKYEKWYYYFWLNYHLNNFIEIAKSKATTMGHIKREDLDKSKVIIMDNFIYDILSKTCKPLIESIINNRINNREITEVRDVLLPKLMSGMVRIAIDN